MDYRWSNTIDYDARISSKKSHLVNDVFFLPFMQTIDIESEGVWRGWIFWYENALLTWVFGPPDLPWSPPDPSLSVTMFLLGSTRRRFLSILMENFANDHVSLIEYSHVLGWWFLGFCVLIDLVIGVTDPMSVGALLVAAEHVARLSWNFSD